jgi:outer membrane protein
MRRFPMIMSVLLVALTAISGRAADGKIAVVDIERLIKLHPRTKQDREVLEQYVEDYESEREELVESMKEMSADFEALRREAADSALSEKAREKAREKAKIKLEELKEKDRKIRETAAERQKELTSQELRMRKRVVADIKEILEKVAKDKGYDFVLASEETAISGYSSVLHFPKAADITEDVLSAIAEAEAETD